MLVIDNEPIGRDWCHLCCVIPGSKSIYTILSLSGLSFRAKDMRKRSAWEIPNCLNNNIVWNYDSNVRGTPRLEWKSWNVMQNTYEHWRYDWTFFFKTQKLKDLLQRFLQYCDTDKQLTHNIIRVEINSVEIFAFRGYKLVVSLCSLEWDEKNGCVSKIDYRNWNLVSNAKIERTSL